MRSLSLILALTAVVACRATPNPVPVLASPESLQAMVGEWEGEYDNPVTGRSGSIVLRLRAGSDTADGDVVMMPRVKVGTTGSGPDAHVTPPAAQPLRIAFVRASGETIMGRMQPYESPDCQCTMQTTFTGRLRGNRIEGTFTAAGSPAGTQTGTWKVKRKG